jgi:RNA polymerase sigma-70 factor (ECF subfamily)
MVGSEQLAEDLTQDAFLLAYRALGRLPDDANESAWLFTIARNRALQDLRRRKILRWVSLTGPRGEQDVRPDGARPLADTVADRDQLRRAMSAVPPTDLSCLLLSIDGHSYHEVGQITGLSTSAVRARIFRARERLRALLSESDEYPTRRCAGAATPLKVPSSVRSSAPGFQHAKQAALARR